jgi:MYXO-CTERM domain-containing protein
VTPLETTTYLLTARGQGGPVQASVTVSVEAQKTGLLPDRGGFRCNVGAGRAGLPWLALLALAAFRRRRRAID